MVGSFSGAYMVDDETSRAWKVSSAKVPIVVGNVAKVFDASLSSTNIKQR